MLEPIPRPEAAGCLSGSDANGTDADGDGIFGRHREDARRDKGEEAHQTESAFVRLGLPGTRKWLRWVIGARKSLGEVASRIA